MEPSLTNIFFTRNRTRWQAVGLMIFFLVSFSLRAEDNLSGENTGLATEAWPELSLTLADAISSTLDQNQDLCVKRYEAELKETEIEIERSQFDRSLEVQLSSSDRIGKQILPSGTLGDSVSNRFDGNVGISRKDLSGTNYSVGLSTSRTRSNRAPNLFGTRFGLELEHPMKRGAGRKVNTIGIRQAELGVKVSQFELQGFVLALVANVEQKYWGYYLAERELEIFQESRSLALLQREETEKKIAIGSIPESELAAAEAELALREEEVINAGSSLEKAKIALLRIINPEAERFWQFCPSLQDHPASFSAKIDDRQRHLENAINLRPELKEAETLLQSDKLEVVRTRNGLLPKLDFFVNLGKTGYASEFGETASEFGARTYDVMAGIRYEIALDRRSAKASDLKARLTLRQSEEAVRNLVKLIQEDVLKAVIEVRRSAQQVLATEKTMEKQKEKLRVEEVKFRVGKTTSFLVAQAQRDYSASLIAQLKAKISYMNSLVDLFRLDGTLLDRWGIVVENP